MNRKLSIVLLLLLIVLPILTAGCSGNYSDAEAMKAIEDYIAKYLEDMEEEEVVEGDMLEDGVTLLLTHPAGRSPKVFTTGWVFGARCSFEGTDYSSSVEWSGSGSFFPGKGSHSRPSFSGPGSNQIVLSVVINNKKYSQTFSVEAVSPAGYASVGSIATCVVDAHGCLACPHRVSGPVTSGSPNVFVNGKPAARVGDVGVHCACCGQNTYKIVTGDPQVLINGRAAARMGSKTEHCGGVGEITAL